MLQEAGLLGGASSSTRVEQLHFFFGMAAHRIAQLFVLECKVEVHKLSLAPKDTYMRKASYLQNIMLRARI